MFTFALKNSPAPSDSKFDKDWLIDHNDLHTQRIQILCWVDIKKLLEYYDRISAPDYEDDQFFYICMLITSAFFKKFVCDEFETIGIEESLLEGLPYDHTKTNYGIMSMLGDELSDEIVGEDYSRHLCALHNTSCPKGIMSYHIKLRQKLLNRLLERGMTEFPVTCIVKNKE